MSHPDTPPEIGSDQSDAAPHQRQQPDARPGLRSVVWLGLVLALPELVLSGADHQFWGSLRWRSVAYSWGAFWNGLLHGWQPNFPLQPWTMFVSYGFLHAGLTHLGGNLVTLLWLGPVVIDRYGEAGFWRIWVASWLGGGVGFALLSHQTGPMVGASGALFGLAAALIVAAAEDRHAERAWARLLRAGVGIAGLMVLNMIGWWWEDGRLAWQTHLGGAVLGVAMALTMPVRKRD